MKTYLIVPDLHVPFHDISYLKLIATIIKDVSPSGIVQLGDAVDFYQVSKFDKDPARKNTIYDDLKTYKSILLDWKDLLKPGSEIIQLEGNHEDRLRRYVWTHAKEIHELVKSVPETLGFKEKNTKGVKLSWHSISDYRSCIIGNCILHHGVFFNQHVGVGNLIRYPMSFIQGHTHRFQYVSNGDRFSCTLGHGSNESETAHSPVPPGWQQALALLHVVNGITHLEPYLVNDGKCLFRGEMLNAKKT